MSFIKYNKDDLLYDLVYLKTDTRNNGRHEMKMRSDRGRGAYWVYKKNAMRI